MRREHVGERVAAELLSRRAGELPRDRRLGDDRERLDRGDVAALDERLRRLAGGEVDRVERPHQRRQRLHRGADDDLLAVRDAGLDPAGAVRAARAGRARSRRGPRSRARARARSRRRSRRPSPPGSPSARPRAARRAAPRASRTSRAPGRRRSRGPRRRRRACRGRRARRRSQPRSSPARRRSRAPSPRPRSRAHASSAFATAPGGDEDRRVPRAGALERVADVLVAELEHAGEVGVARPRQRHRLRPLARRLALRRPRTHPPRPVLVVAVADDERERRPERAAVAEPGEHLDLVLLELLPRAAAVALLAAAEVGVDRGAVEHEPGGQAGQDRDERRPVRLAGGGESEASRGRAYCGAHDVNRRGHPGPELERRGALRDEDVEAVDDARRRRRARRPRAPSRRPSAR